MMSVLTGGRVRLGWNVSLQEVSCVLCIAFSRKYEPLMNHDNDDRAGSRCGTIEKVYDLWQRIGL